MVGLLQFIAGTSETFFQFIISIIRGLGVMLGLVNTAVPIVLSIGSYLPYIIYSSVLITVSIASVKLFLGR